MTQGSVTRAQTTLWQGAARVFDLSLGEMLWSRRTIFMLLVVGGPVAIALVFRGFDLAGAPGMRVNHVQVGGSAIFGIMMWMLFVKFIVPVLGVFYGTSLLADEVEDKTITYLFTRPVRRSAVALGKYLAYVVCTALIVLPSVMLVYFLVMPIGNGSIGAGFRFLVKDLALLGGGLLVYGAVFAFIGAALKRPLLVGLLFAFGWEQTITLVPGYLKRLTVSYYLQALVPHTIPDDNITGLLQSLFQDYPPPIFSILALAGIGLLFLWLMMIIVEKREFVLEQ